LIVVSTTTASLILGPKNIYLWILGKTRVFLSVKMFFCMENFAFIQISRHKLCSLICQLSKKNNLLVCKSFWSWILHSLAVLGYLVQYLVLSYFFLKIVSTKYINVVQVHLPVLPKCTFKIQDEVILFDIL